MKGLKTKLRTAMMMSALATATAADADHNSVWGEGWANMPNDIHNTRIDTLDGDQQSLRDFVREGEGAGSVNRYLDGSDASTAHGGYTLAGGARSIGGA